MEQAASGLVIDWRLLLLQAGNFLLLLGVLTWLVWKPLLRLIEDRRQMIAEGVAAAAASQHAAAEAEAARQTLLADARRDAAQLVAETREELKTERERTVAELARERDKFAAEARAAAAAERARALAALRAHAADLVTRAAGTLIGRQPERDQVWASELEKTLQELR